MLINSYLGHENGGNEGEKVNPSSQAKRRHQREKQ